MDQTTIVKLQDGDHLAWIAFRDQYLPLIRSVACWRKWGFDEHTREDIVQDILAELPRVVGNFKGDSSFEYFIKRVCIHRCIDRLRKVIREKGRYESLIHTDENGVTVERDVPAGDDFDPVKELLVRERAELLMNRVKQLDETCQTAIVLFYSKGHSYRQMAEQLGITVNTVGSRLAKCLSKLRDILLSDEHFKEYRVSSVRQDREEQKS